MHTFPTTARHMVFAFLLLALFAMLITFGGSLKNKYFTESKAVSSASDPSKRGNMPTDASAQNNTPTDNDTATKELTNAEKMMAAMSAETTNEVTELMRKVQSNPNDTDALTNLAELFISMQEWSRADSFLSKAIMSRPSDKRARYLSGISLFRQNQYEKAAEAFNDLLQLHEDAPAMYNLAILYKHFLNKPDEAKALLQKAAALPTIDETTKKLIEDELATTAQ